MKSTKSRLWEIGIDDCFLQQICEKGRESETQSWSQREQEKEEEEEETTD